MAKEIVWTETSLRDRLTIYQFWLAHNRSNTYSEKLELLFDKSAQLLAKFPQAGMRTDIEGVSKF